MKSDSISNISDIGYPKTFSIKFSEENIEFILS